MGGCQSQRIARGCDRRREPSDRRKQVRVFWLSFLFWTLHCTRRILISRFIISSSVRALQKHLTDLITPLAHSFSLSVRAFGLPLSLVAEHAVGEVVLSDAWSTALEPSPITPTGESGPWRLLSGTIKATAESRVQGSGAAVIPNLAMGKCLIGSPPCLLC